jgi:hypothetical protein
VLQRKVAFARRPAPHLRSVSGLELIAQSGSSSTVHMAANRCAVHLGHIVVGHLQDPEAAASGHERVANCPVLALGDKRGRVDRLTCGELEQITALAADVRSLVRLRSVSIVLSGDGTNAPSRDATVTSIASLAVCGGECARFAASGDQHAAVPEQARARVLAGDRRERGARSAPAGGP